MPHLSCKKFNCFIGCFEIKTISGDHSKYQGIVQQNIVEECYLKCHLIRCGQNESIYFALKGSLCFCICNIQRLLSQSNKCNKSCSSYDNCHTDNHINVYTEYAMENKGSDGFCLVCANADTKPNANLSDFGCDGEHFGRCVTIEDNCYEMKEDNGNLNFSNTDCEQHLPYICQKYNGNQMFSHVNPTKTSTEKISNYNESEVTSTILDQSSEVTLTSVVISSEEIVRLSEETSTTTVQSFELSSKYRHEVSSSITFQHFSNSPASIDKATASTTDTVGAIVGLLSVVFALSSLVLSLWFYKTKRKEKLLDSQIDLHQPQTSQTVSNTYTDMVLVSGTNRTQNDVTFTTTTNDVRNDDIYVENEEGEYDHLHSSRPQKAVSESEDERYATSFQLEDVSYSIVRKSMKSVPDRDIKNDSMVASLDNNFLSVANPDYDFCYQSRHKKD